MDVRILAATNKDLSSMVEQGKFREDLFYRFKIIEIHFPPLRERPDDISLLVDHFVRTYSEKLGKPIEQIDPQFKRYLERYPFPGNIRELEGIVQRAIILTKENHISASDLPPEVLECSKITSDLKEPFRPVISLARTNEELKTAREEASRLAIAEVERAFLKVALEEAGGNITRAAEKTGMNRSLFQRMIKKHEIQVDKKKYKKD